MDADLGCSGLGEPDFARMDEKGKRPGPKAQAE